MLPAACVAAAFTTRGHVVRALLEAICFQSREVLEAMMLDTHTHRTSSLARGLSGALADEALDLAAGGQSHTDDLAPQGAAPNAGSKQVEKAAGFTTTLNLLRVDGGATHNNLLMQLQV